MVHPRRSKGLRGEGGGGGKTRKPETVAQCEALTSTALMPRTLVDGVPCRVPHVNSAPLGRRLAVATRNAFR